MMTTARVRRIGKKRMIQLPDEFPLQGPEVEIFQRGDEIVLREKSENLERAFHILVELDLNIEAIEELRKLPPQEREEL